MENKNDEKYKIISLISNFLSRIQGLFLKFCKLVKSFTIWKAIKKIWETIRENGTGLLALATFAMAFFTLQLAQTNRELVDYTRQTNERAAKLFVGQNKPLIDVTPISITPGVSKVGKDETDMATTRFSVVNYSGFDACDIVIDVKYGKDNDWLSEWLKADDDNEKEIKGVVTDKIFHSAPKAPMPDSFIPELKSGDVRKCKNTGSLNLEKTVCNAGHDGFPVFVRVTWKNEKGHVFDEIHKYKLTCTKKDLGRAFTFIPESIISQKD